MENAHAKLYFEPGGTCVQRGPMSLSQYIEILIERVQLFLTKLESCDRGPEGEHLLHDANAGTMTGFRAVWKQVNMICSMIVFQVTCNPTEAQIGTYERDGALAVVGVQRRHEPLLDAVTAINFALALRPGGVWATAVPAAIGRRLAALNEELRHHAQNYRQNEGWGNSAGSPMHLLSHGQELLAAPAAKVATEGRQRTGDLRGECAAGNDDFKPVRWFEENCKNVSVSRLQHAARAGRKSKRVRRKWINDEWRYSWSDAKRAFGEDAELKRRAESSPSVQRS